MNWASGWFKGKVLYGRLLANPSRETLLELEDEMVIIGTRQQLRNLEGSV
ncbi:hypothetical protein ACFLTK_02885 [Chloroflexota bacterium]